MKLRHILREVQAELKKSLIYVKYDVRTHKPGIEKVTWSYKPSKRSHPFMTFYVKPDEIKAKYDQIVKEWVKAIRFVDANIHDLTWQQIQYLRDIQKGYLVAIKPVPEYIATLEEYGLLYVTEKEHTFYTILTDEGKEVLYALEEF